MDVDRLERQLMQTQLDVPQPGFERTGEVAGGGGSGCDHEVVAGPTGPAPPARRALDAQVHRGLPAVVAQADVQAVRTGCDFDGNGAPRMLDEVLTCQTEPM